MPCPYRIANSPTVSTPPETAALTPGGRVRLARENLCLAMALYAASHRGLITATLVPNRAELNRESGQTFDASVPLQVADHRSLLRTTGNQVRGAFALLAMQTQREAETVFGPVSHVSPPAAGQPDVDLWNARVATYLIAQSVALDLMAPTWRIPPEFRQSYAIAGMDFALDAASLHGEEIRWGHFGSLARYLDLSLFVSYCLDGIDISVALQASSGNYGLLGLMAEHFSREMPSASPISDVGGYGSGSGRLRRYGALAEDVGSDAPAGWIAPEGPPEPRISVASQATEMGPVDEFVADACSTGSRAMNLAGDLYTSYANWCLDHGYLAHSQRKFGLELRARGYERKRRGKGRHWWIGVESRA